MEFSIDIFGLLPDKWLAFYQKTSSVRAFNCVFAIFLKDRLLMGV